MVEYIKKLILRKELNKIKASSEEQFYNILCNKYNKGLEFTIEKENEPIDFGSVTQGDIVVSQELYNSYVKDYKRNFKNK